MKIINPLIVLLLSIISSTTFAQSMSKKELVADLNYKAMKVADKRNERSLIFMYENDTVSINQPLEVLIKGSDISKSEALEYYGKNINKYAKTFTSLDEFKEFKVQLISVGFKYVQVVVDDRMVEYVSDPIKL
ncbi:MAG: hypothetical protein KQI35_14360 [Bacteroidetes bacterium]|nr:hypothetical protein [Bacteroidota bacterium]